MPKKNGFLINTNNKSCWVTIKESLEIVNKLASIKLSEGDVYRHALYGNIRLSIYFQSSIILRKVSTTRNKVKMRLVKKSFLNRLCFLDDNFLLNDINIISSTEGKYISPNNNIIDTNLLGLEYIAVQHLLANSLSMPTPVKGVNNVIQGISVDLFDDTYLLYEKITWRDRINQQIMKLPQEIAAEFHSNLQYLDMSLNYKKEYFPVYSLPSDAFFVIKDKEITKLINSYISSKKSVKSSTRISTPLSRLFWLACKNNETISPLIKHPYKLLSIFEQWAFTEGITDRLSGDTLKTALERGSPSSISEIY
ncbi:hypothetical protein H4F35_04895 [Pectobacterium versatile]|uniref:Uncharacterized protein n=1 Tax=Klebsiella huaxiensis TaxID=2153354 RepID=A0ABT6EHX5_9ENTR|nr:MULTISPECIES: hypothetical protein [Enterobacterales]MBN3059084.1 hypothetical protein [Pectobacterium versatile]MDG1644179.1 hypothetical protein [Klebsiella huaxiensis]